MEELKTQLSNAAKDMDKVLAHTKSSLGKIRAGKASPSMLDGVKVEYYGNLTPLNQVAAVNTVDARTIVIKPWDKSLIEPIETGIIKCGYIDVSPQSDGEVIHLNIPPLTEETRKKLLKQVKDEAEKGRISIRNVRKDTKDLFKKLKSEGFSEDLVRDSEDDLQKQTDLYISKIDSLLQAKEKDLMEL